MDPLRLFVVRNGGTAWTVERRFAGSRDVPLSPEGRVRAESAARALRDVRVAAVYSSPLERSSTTAAIVAKHHALDVTSEPAFRDMAFGAWEGLTPDDVASRFPRDWAVWREAPHTVTGHGGERVADVAARVSSGLAKLQGTHGGETVVLVTHAIVVRLIVLAAIGLGPDRLWTVDASPAGISELEYARDWVSVHRMNTLAHLDAPVTSAVASDPQEGLA